MRIVAAPNAFKGSMDARQAAEAMKRGVLAAAPLTEVTCVPVADGGDGLTEVMVEALGGSLVEKNVQGPRFEEQAAQFCLAGDVAVIEMARASGLALLAKEQQDPTKTSTFGTGELIGAALGAGVRRIVVGIGGSATCDGGIGMASALGFKFLSRRGEVIKPIGGNLQLIHSIDGEGVDPRLENIVLEAVCDVTNPLVGKTGASYVYSPQKGATPEQVQVLDEGLRHLADVVERDMGVIIHDLEGAGAAGGLGGGLHAFLGAELKNGIDLVIDMVGLEEKIAGADLVLTSEGQIDFQTKYDKAPAGVARVARRQGVPCIAVCGGIGERVDELHEIGMTAVFSLCRGPQSLESAMLDGFDLLTRQVEQVVRAFMAGRKSGR